MAPPPTLVSAHAPPHMSAIHLSLRHFKPALLQKKAARLHGLGPTCLLVTCLLVAEGPPSSLSHRHGIHTQPRSAAIHQAPDPPSSLFSLHDRLSPSSLSLQGCAQQKGGGAGSLCHVSHLFTRLDKQITCFFSRFLNGVTLGWTCSNNKSMGRVKPSGVL